MPSRPRFNSSNEGPKDNLQSVRSEHWRGGGVEGRVPDEMVAGRMTQVPAILGIDIEEESCV